MIYVFGNSHAHFFTNSSPSRFGEGENRNDLFRSFSLGPIIAYNFYEHHFPTMIQWMNQLPITAEDYIIFAVGEVDCRWHLLHQAEKQQRDVIELTHECIDRFFSRGDLLFVRMHREVGRSEAIAATVLVLGFVVISTTVVTS